MRARDFACATIASAFVLAAGRARALDEHPIFVSPGYVHSFVGGSSPAAGNGGEVSVVVGTSESGTRAGEGVGAFAQLEALHGDSGTSARWALGAQASVLGLGFEAAFAQRGADDAHTTTRVRNEGARSRRRR